VQASYTGPSVNEGKWSVAQPGKPSNLPSKKMSADSGWRATKEQIPVADASEDRAATKNFEVSAVGA
jgi:hypothetical protein